MKRIKDIFFTLLAIALVVLIPHSGIIPIPFAYCIPVLAIVWFFLKQQKEDFASIGFSFRRFQPKALLVGALTAVVLFFFLNKLFFPLLAKIIDLPAADLGSFANIKGNTGFYIFLLAMGWIVGGFYEEIVFHGFIFARIEKHIAGKLAMPVAFFLSNLIFALYHLQLGVEGVINAFIAGSVYHGLMLYYKRNMWYAVFCHAFFDTIALTALYTGYGS
ncbi:MAG TPA: CPBP family intramembrane metalloprotease [Ferruginibacter sp.]|nr:CPBP family intramembrane metalloprotease [Ferruginibacter sp.]